MDFAMFKAQLLEHYVSMASLPWAKAAAWHTVKELAHQHPSEFGDLPDLLVAEMQKARDETPPSL